MCHKPTYAPHQTALSFDHLVRADGGPHSRTKRHGAFDCIDILAPENLTTLAHFSPLSERSWLVQIAPSGSDFRSFGSPGLPHDSHDEFVGID
jgi:hypothetical protein